MAVKKNGLGKGLDSLISDRKVKETSPEVKVTKQIEIQMEPLTIDINKVEPNRNQPRRNFDEDALLELAESVKQFGILQPLLVQKKEDYYEIIAGERRWRAAKLAKLKQVPVIIKELTEQQIVEISLIENIQRENLNPIEEAVAFQRLITEFNLKQDELAERVSKSRTAVTNSMRLLKLSESVQQMLVDELISTGHARALLGLDNEEVQYSIAQKIFDEKLSVRDTEKLIKKLQKEKKIPEKETIQADKKMEAIYHSTEEKMKVLFGTKVNIQSRNNWNKGKIEIEYYSPEELSRIIDLLESIQTN